MEREPRISRNPSTCTQFMIRTDKLQRSVLTPPDTLRYTLFGWTAEESQAWSDFRTKCEAAYKEYSDPDKTGYAVRIKMHTLIKEIRRYDNHRSDGHHLLDKVAVNGTIDDCLVFNIKRGTPLAAKPTHSREDIIEFYPNLVVTKIDEGYHMLKVHHPQNPNSSALPEGIMFVKIFRFIGTQPPTSLNQYDMIGNAKRSKFKSDFSELNLQTDKKVFAWYFACYESKKGLMGLHGPVERAPVFTSYD